MGEEQSQLSEEAENAVARKNAVLYSICMAIGGAAAPVSIALGGIAGSYLLGTDKSLATAPVTGYNIGVALTALPAAMLMRKIGRRLGFQAGALIGVIGMLLAVQALTIQSFWLFVIALLLVGCAGSFTQQYRFAAADRGTPQYKPKAISWVLVGGVGAAIVGPQLIIHAKDYLAPIPFAGAYLWAAGLLVITIFVLYLLEPGNKSNTLQETTRKPQRSLAEIISQPRFIVAVLCGTSAYALMSYVMTAAPLAMLACGFDVDQSTWGIQWHVLAMFAPSFITGNLIARYGKEKMIFIGMVMLVACAIVSLNGISLAHFYIGLILLGLGWNFAFIASTAMVTDTYEPHEKSKAQGANDFILFGSVALASLMSGFSLNGLGWDFINWVVFPVVGISLAGLWWLSRKEAKAV